jgi:hypothetical protein
LDPEFMQAYYLFSAAVVIHFQLPLFGLYSTELAAGRIPPSKIPTSHRGVGVSPYGFQLVDRAYNSERPEAAFRFQILPTSTFRIPTSENSHFPPGRRPLWPLRAGGRIPTSHFRKFPLPHSHFPLPFRVCACP